LEVVAKAIYLLNFYTGSSMCPPTMWIISGLRSRRKNDATPALFLSWTWPQLRSSWFSWAWLRLLFVFTRNLPVKFATYIWAVCANLCGRCELSSCPFNCISKQMLIIRANVWRLIVAFTEANYSF